MNRRRFRVFAQALLLIVSALLLLFVFRVRTLRPSHPYPAPDFTLRDLNGNAVRLSNFRGKGVVLNFWATWCGPCRKEIPWFIQLQKEYGLRGLQVIGVSMDDDGSKTVMPFVERTGINYPVLFDDGHVSSLYGGVEILPTTYYIDRNGTVLAFVKGVISKDEVEANIQQTLKEPPTEQRSVR
jgi:peroxiredoxin